MNGRAARMLLVGFVLASVAALAAFGVAGSGPLSPVLAVAGESDEGEPGDEAAEEEGEARDYFLFTRQAPGEAILSGDLQNAADQAQAIAAKTARELPGLVNPEWTFAGPSNVGGRVTDIAPDPTQPGRVFIDEIQRLPSLRPSAGGSPTSHRIRPNRDGSSSGSRRPASGGATTAA